MSFGQALQVAKKIWDEDGTQNTLDKLMEKRFTPEQRQNIEEAAEKKIRDIKAAKEFRELCLKAVKTLGNKSPKTDNWRLFRESLIISYFSNRGSGQYSDQLGTLSVIQEKTLIWNGIDDKPVADFSDVAKIVKGWLEADSEQ